MPFSSLRNRVNSLPLIIAGPILRRTELTGVTVWLALKESASQIRLDIYDGAAVVATGQLALTTALGDMLHIAVLKAIPLAPAVLAAGRIYEYNVFFGGEIGKDLDGSEILSAGSGGIAAISYAPRQRPSFVFPGATAADLRLAHGSCRKPHGGAGDPNDALRALDMVLETSHNDLMERPQQFFLTGDQIYADDVADALLFMLSDAAESILGWPEPLPGNPGDEQLKPGKRLELVAGTSSDPGLTSTHARSHLITLGEFYCMYLFAWSDVLWSDPPEFETVFPGELKHLPARASFEHIPPPAPRDRDIYAHFKKEISSLLAFKSSLPAVRRALANIPVYMMFDDHEVTDDWFRSLKWAKNVLQGNLLSRRIIQNGLSAFAVFQAWGNTPDTFAGPGIVDVLKQLHSEQGFVDHRWTEIGVHLLPAILAAGDQTILEAASQWHFTIEFQAHTLIALDTRTHRGYASKNAPPSLINSNHFPVQIPNRPAPKEITIVLSPAPVFGHFMMEEVIQPIAESIPIFGGGDTADFEAWGFQRHTFQDLLHRLVDYQRVVILSGDVHYGFSATIDYWDDRMAAPRQARFVQLCSSALKNDSGAKILDSPAGPRMFENWFGWDDAAAEPLGKGAAGPLGQRFEVPPLASPRVTALAACWVVPPKWQYTVTFSRDDRQQAARGIISSPATSTNARQQAAMQHARTLTWDAQRTVVAQNNLGIVNIRAAPPVPGVPASLAVEQLLWYVPLEETNTNAIRPYTVYSLPLTPFATAVRPGAQCP